VRCSRRSARGRPSSSRICSSVSSSRCSAAGHLGPVCFHAAWTAQQIVEAAGPDTTIARLIRDRDGIYGAVFDGRVDHLGIRQLRIAPRSPWQNGYAERWVGTLRREVLDHVIVLGEQHLRRLVRQHARYYKEGRPHMSLGGDAPLSRALEPPGTGEIVALSRVGGLHHRDVKKAA